MRACRSWKKSRRKGEPPKISASGTGYSVEHLGRARERISWQAYCTFAQNIRRFWADEELFEFGTQTLGHPAARNIRHFAEFLVDAIDLYRLAVRVARWNISCIEVLLLEIDPRNLRMTFRMLPGYQPCEGYFLVTRGVVAAIPELIGLPRAEVTRSDHRIVGLFRYSSHSLEEVAAHAASPCACGRKTAIEELGS